MGSDSVSLLEEDNLNEWFSETKSNLLTDIEDEQGVELVQEYKKEDKAYTCKEIDDLNDMSNDVENSNVNNKPENSNTKVSERFSNTDPEAAKKGTIIRVLWAPKTTDSYCWIQGVVTKTFVSEMKNKKETVKKNKVT